MTGLLTTSGSQFQDWSASYRLFSQQRLPIAEIFSVVRRNIVAQLPAGAPLRAVLDDSLLRRSGLHTPGVAWRRDPLGPRFQTNFVRAQRFLQISAALPGDNGLYRLAPIAFLHTPTPPKPPRKATGSNWRSTVATRGIPVSVCARSNRSSNSAIRWIRMPAVNSAAYGSLSTGATPTPRYSNRSRLTPLA